jgi:hypothetical protein
MTRARSGFTLMEALLSSALFLLVLTCIVQGISQLGQLTRYFEDKTETFAAATTIMNRLCSDAIESSSILTPAPGDPATYSQWVLTKIEPSQWPNFFPSPPPANWDPKDPSLREQRSYSLVGDQLQCQIQFGSNSLTQVVGVGVDGFTVRRIPWLNLELRLGYQVQGRFKTFVRRVQLPQLLERAHP